MSYCRSTVLGGGFSYRAELGVAVARLQYQDGVALKTHAVHNRVASLQASFYLQYILTNGLLAKGVAFLKLPGAAIYFLLSRLAGTKRQKKKCWANQYMKYGAELADHTMTVLLMLLFGVQQPFLPIVALAYFICIYFYARYDLLYTQREAYQSGGLFWPVVWPPSRPERICCVDLNWLAG